jgi:hypothetical protein
MSWFPSLIRPNLFFKLYPAIWGVKTSAESVGVLLNGCKEAIYSEKHFVDQKSLVNLSGF